MDDGDRETYVGDDGPRESGRMRLAIWLQQLAERVEKRFGSDPPPAAHEEAPMRVTPVPVSARH